MSNNYTEIYNAIESLKYDSKMKILGNISNEWQCPEQWEGGKCPVRDVLGFDCDKNDNHCVVKVFLDVVSMWY